MQTENFGQLKVHINYRGEKINPLRNKDAGNLIKWCIVKSNYNRGVSHILQTTPSYFLYIALSEVKPSGAEAKSLQPLTQSRCFMLLSQQRELYPLSYSTSSSYSFYQVVSSPNVLCIYCLPNWPACQNDHDALLDLYIAHETAICHSSLIHRFAIDRK